MEKTTMRWSKAGLMVLLVAQTASIVYLQDKIPAYSMGNPKSIGEQMTIESVVFNQERTILISLPAGYSDKANRYPASISPTGR